MEKMEWTDFFNSNSVRVAKLLKQHWKQQAFSYLVTPRPDYGFLLLTHGQVQIKTKQEILVAQAGDMIFLPKYSNYEAIFPEEAEDYLINFDMTEDKGMVANPFKVLSNTPLSCVECFIALVEEYISGSATSFKLTGLFYLLVDNVINSALAQGSLKSEVIEKSKQLLRSDEELKIPQIARACAVSESGLRKKFKVEVGMSLSEYRMKFKMDKAKYLLESTDMSVAEVADTLNLYDAAYFCKKFKQFTGQSPKEFIKSKRL